MRTAIHSWSFRNRFKQDPDFTIEQALQITADMGFTGIEIMSGKAGGDTGDFHCDDPAYLRSVKDHADRVGVDILSLSTYNDFAYVLDEDWRRANIAYIKDWLKIASDLGVPNIRMLTGYYREGQDPKRLEDLTLEGIAECVPVAEQTGTNMSIENHNTIFFQAEEILGLIDRFGSDRLTTCPDPSNWGGKAFWDHDCPVEVKDKVFESAARLAPKATQSHLKVKGVTEDGKLVGFLDDLDRLLRSYRDGGYDGAIAFESIIDGDDLIGPLAEAKRIVDDAIRRVGGAG